MDAVELFAGCLSAGCVKDHYVDPEKGQPPIRNFRRCLGLGEEPGNTFRAES
jgi:hypothetical protein